MARQKNDGKGRLGGRDRFVESLDGLEPSEYIRVFTGLLNYASTDNPR